LGAVGTFAEAVEDSKVVLAARLVTKDVEQVRLQRLPALPGKFAEPCAQFLGYLTDLEGNHACNSTCSFPGARLAGAGRAKKTDE